MKFYLFIFIILLTFLECSANNKVTFAESETKSENELKNSGPICINSCSTCQNTLYYLKIHGKIDCRFTQCPENCLLLTNEFFSNRNDHINFYNTNQISNCEACFRLNMCHMSECNQQEMIVHQAIDNSLRQIPNFHMVQSDSEVYQILNKDSDDYFFNMDLVLKNMDKLLVELDRYYNLFKFSESVKSLYIKLYEKVQGEEFETGKSDINTGDFTFKYLKYINQYKQLNSFFRNELQKKKLAFTGSESMLNSLVISGENKVLGQYQKLEEQVKSLMKDVEDLSDNLRNVITWNVKVVNRIKQFMLNGSADDNDNKVKSKRNTDVKEKGNTKLQTGSSKSIGSMNSITNTDHISDDSDENNEIDNKIKRIKKLSKHHGSIVNDFVLNEPSITQDTSKNAFKVFKAGKNKLKGNKKEKLGKAKNNEKNIVINKVNDFENNTSTNGGFNFNTTQKVPLNQVINHNHTDEEENEEISDKIELDKTNPKDLGANTKVNNEKVGDLDALMDMRNNLIKNTSVVPNKDANKNKLKLKGSVKQAIDEEIGNEKKDKEKEEDSLSHLFHKTMKVMRHLNKRINKLKRKKEKDETEATNQKAEDYDNKVKEIENVKLKDLNLFNINSSRHNNIVLNDSINNSTNHTEILESEKNFTIKNIITRNHTEVNKRTEIALNMTTNSTSKLDTRNKSELPIQKEKNLIKKNNRAPYLNPNKATQKSTKESPIRLIPNKYFGSFSSPKSKVTITNKMDREDTLLGKAKVTPVKIPREKIQVNNDRKKSVFSMMFLEKSLKKLDDDFFFITQNLYPDLTFY